MEKDRKQNQTQTKQSETSTLFAVQGIPRPQWTPTDYLALATQGYMANPIAYACVRMVADNGARLKWILTDSNGYRVPFHPLQSLIERPNPWQGTMEFLTDLISSLQISGNAYIEAVSVTPDGLPSELYVLRPDRMTVVVGEQGWPLAYDYSVSGRKVRLSAGEKGQILHLKAFSPTNDYYGQSPMESASRSIDVYNTATQFQKGLLDNSARPSGCLMYTPQNGQGNLTADQFNRLKDELLSYYAGSKNAGRPMILDGGLEWRAMSLTPAEMEFVKTRHGAARDIALCFGVPPLMLGLPEDNTYSNYSEALKAFTRYTLLPVVERVIAGFNRWLCPRYDNTGEQVRFGLDLESIPAFLPEREALWERLNKADFLTVDEKRALLGYPPLS